MSSIGFIAPHSPATAMEEGLKFFDKMLIPSTSCQEINKSIKVRTSSHMMQLKELGDSWEILL